MTFAVPGVLSTEQVRRTGDFIASLQAADGAIPWFSGGHVDPWDHVEAAMGLTVTGHLSEAAAAYQWLIDTQRPDGSWPMSVRDGVVIDAAADTNQCAYIAVGAWHFYLVTQRIDALTWIWPTVERALNFVVRAQRPGGELAWAADDSGRLVDGALLTGCSSSWQALRCGELIAHTIGVDRPRWRWAANILAEAICDRPALFLDKSRFSMDWYYPVLSGALRGPGAASRVCDSWSRYVMPGEGVRCVDDEPWVTAAETVELVAALDAIGESASARKLFAEIQSLRDDETGGYWTGRNVVNDQVWPVEQTSWTAGAMLLAADALVGATGGASLWRDLGVGSGVIEVDKEAVS
ncbi:prenyltransferase [Branchiibius sp. NY16-3462-2]|uniref:prenyltransferase n=1 Tax=Branchiibius sp. NY16-3462-2 TaxID=1807500 RepID=UPI0007928494|nr:prenyltransferase [Branchiibius sp. NY16-3462-2]KYH44254.1 prenyltransferase [Branchiibius sp. NY16-3462-2]